MTEIGIHGVDPHAKSVAGYEPHEHYQGQKDSRVVKHLRFPYQVEIHNPVQPDGAPILQARIAKRGDELSTEELGLYALERGERLGSFFTDAELARFNRSGRDVEAADTGEFSPATAGEYEIAEWIENNKPNVEDTVALAGDDPETAKRVLAAEQIATKGVPRAGVEQKLAPIIAKGEPNE